MERKMVKTPFYLIQEKAMEENLEILAGVQKRTGCHILLAQKAFSMFRLYPLIGQYLCGTTASGLYEARLGAQEMGKENHIFSPAYQSEEFPEIASICDHVIFNSFQQLEKFGPCAIEHGASIGLRINPQCSTQEGHEIYDPCSPGSRLGIPLAEFQPEQLAMVEGLHFHTLCEQNADDLATTLDAVEEKFGPWLGQMKWLNFGGGHHITRKDYDLNLLESCITRVQERYGVAVYLEPGEAVALNAGELHCKVLEVQPERDHMPPAVIVDTSAACHMPDVLEMPYRPPLKDSGEAGEKAYTYRLAGPTCLAGDVIGSYSFDEPLTEGTELVFQDMAIYTMVKNNTFNGMALPSIVLERKDGTWEMVRQFGYEDFKMRLS